MGHMVNETLKRTMPIFNGIMAKTLQQFPEYIVKGTVFDLGTQYAIVVAPIEFPEMFNPFTVDDKGNPRDYKNLGEAWKAVRELLKAHKDVKKSVVWTPEKKEVII